MVFHYCSLFTDLPQSSLAAVGDIGVFSWPALNEAFWMARVFWCWSLSLAFFSLSNSAVYQLVDMAPGLEEQWVSERQLRAFLPLFVTPISRQPLPDTEKPQYRPRWTMIWVWQCTVVLMNWSWICFYAGFLLYVLSPIIPDQDPPSRQKV